MSENATENQDDRSNRRKVIAAGLVGNVMEWYDFAVYGFFASIIGTHFFPTDNPAVSLIAAFGAFAATKIGALPKGKLVEWLDTVL